MNIALTRNRTAIIDDEDFDLVMGLTKHWQAVCTRGLWYAQGYRGTSRQNFRPVTMHRVIMGEPEGLHVHHQNGDGLDNRRSNLVACTASDHSCTKRWPNKTGFRGVCFEPSRGKYVAHIRPRHGKTIKLGRFDTAEEAALAYDRAAKIEHGQFATLNFP